MQKYNCALCHEDASGGSSIVVEGVFLKVCADCAEDEKIYEELLDAMMKVEEEVDK